MGLFLLAAAPLGALLLAVVAVGAFAAGVPAAAVPLLLAGGWVAAFAAVRASLLAAKGL